MDKKRVKLLQWFMAFANLDFDQLQVPEKVKVMSEVQLLIEAGLWGSSDSPPDPEVDSNFLRDRKFDDEVLQRIRNIQTSFREVFENAMKEVDSWAERNPQLLDWNEVQQATPLGSLPQKTEPLKRQPRQSGIKPLEEPLQVNLTVDVWIPIEVEAKQEGEKIYVRLVPEWRETSAFQLDSWTDPYGEMLSLIFLKSLNGVPISAFHRCKECNRWYLHVTRRKREYCSNLCAARAANRARRAKEKAANSETHQRQLQAGARRARDSYVKKQTSKTPKVKVARRPWKHKTDDH
jgi:hypothetical protein